MAERDRKGTFGERRLPVTPRYVSPINRNPMVLAGLAVAAALVGWVLLDLFVLDGDVVSAGPLSTHHAVLEETGQCTACHDGFASATEDKCGVCHEAFSGPVAAHGFPAHVLYRSGNFQRLDEDHGEGLACRTCHTEHQGRTADITRVANATCEGCHGFGGFDDHPEFAFLARDEKDHDGLRFTHTKHVQRLVKRKQLEQPETACLYCHHAEDDGGFAPIDFATHCDGCHFSGAEESEALPVQGPGRPGALTLTQIRRERGPGTEWAALEDPGAYQIEGGEITKTALRHADPWILHNLQNLQRQIRPGRGLSDLLWATTDAAPGETRALYREAIETLERYVAELSSRPEAEVHDELDWATGLLAAVRRQVDDPFTELDPSRFEPPDGEPPADRLEVLVGLVEGLTSECTKCHGVREATLARVQHDQSILRRARFDHGPHMLQVDCLDCHDRLPIREFATSSEKVPADVGGASVQNLPGVGSCQSCHTPQQAGADCATCHDYHPHKDRSAFLVRHVDG